MRLPIVYNEDGIGMRQQLKKFWQCLKIKQKIQLYTNIVIFVIFVSIFLAVWAIKSSLFDFSTILRDNSLSSDFVQCMERESELFEAYARTGNEDVRAELDQAIADTQGVVGQLPYDYKKIGEERYAKTWSIFNMYQVYCEKRDNILNTEGRPSDYVASLYEVYEIQDFLQSYAKELMRDTLESGVSIYADKVRTIIIIPVVIIVFELIFFLCIHKMSELMNSSIVSPVMELAEASHRIAENDFSIGDVKLQSEDEMGELVHAFNKMKYATGEYITALEERRKALDLYHAEELEKLEMASRLNDMELDLLKSQINPHFLFNTLNVIGGMANLEGAQTTEAMIQSLSFLFRYNLKTPEEKVSLARELKVVRDYMFIQEKRFGSRITYEIDCQTDPEMVLIPTFTFQPLIENAIIHGLAPKEAGGQIRIRIRGQRGMICIAVADNGIGMDRDSLKSLRQGLYHDEINRTARTSIGLFNIYKRVHTMYGNGVMQIHSKPGVGTIVSIRIPDERGNNSGK